MKREELDRHEEKELLLEIESYDINIKNDPEDDEAYYGKAVPLIKLGKQKEALECLSKAISINPDKPAYHAYKARLYAEVKDYKQAEVELKAINFDRLSNNTCDRHIKNMIKNIQAEHQKLVAEKNSKFKEKTESLLTSKNLIMLGEQKKLEIRIENLEEENKQLKATVNKL